MRVRAPLKWRSGMRKTGASLGQGLADQGIEQERLAAGLLERVCREAGVERASVMGIVATGYGRKRHAIRPNNDH